MANPELGAKQICPNCQSKFYDLNRRPAVCPKCGEQFDPEEALKSRRVRARSITPDYDAEDEKEAPAPKEQDGYEDEADETPEIDEAAESDTVETDDEDSEPGASSPSGDGDLGVDFAEDEELADDEDSDDVPFLEDEDDDDNLDDEIEGLPGEGDDD